MVAAHSAESRVLMHALLDELSEIYHNFLNSKSMLIEMNIVRSQQENQHQSIDQ